jgi:cell division protein ZapA
MNFLRGDNMNVVSVKINGVVYNLKGEENEEYLQKVAKYADKKIKEITSKNQLLSISSAAVLSAVNIADELFKAMEECSELKKSNRMYENELEELKGQLSYMEQSNSELMQRLENSIDADLLSKTEAELEKVKNELSLMEETAQKYVEKNNQLKAENKEARFNLQTTKYKVLDLQNKLMESQINVAKEKKAKNIPEK